MVNWDEADSGYVQRDVVVQSTSDGPLWLELEQMSSAEVQGQRSPAMSRLCISVSTDDPCPAPTTINEGTSKSSSDAPFTARFAECPRTTTARPRSPSNCTLVRSRSP